VNKIITFGNGRRHTRAFVYLSFSYVYFFKFNDITLFRVRICILLYCVRCVCLNFVLLLYIISYIYTRRFIYYIIIIIIVLLRVRVPRLLIRQKWHILYKPQYIYTYIACIMYMHCRDVHLRRDQTIYIYNIIMVYIIRYMRCCCYRRDAETFSCPRGSALVVIARNWR